MAFSVAETIRKYDERMFCPLADEFYEGSQFYNFGYWTGDTGTAKEACERLLDSLLDFIPEKTGSILDVACGLGATTRYLLKHYAPTQVTGVNISENQIAQCRQNCPECTFQVMDAAKCEFPDAAFDNVLCVEAAFHFDTREAFLKEALRILKPGGRLVLTDILARRWMMRSHRGMPEANFVPDVDEYRRLYERAGFADTQIEDATQACWGAFYRHFWEWRRQKRKAGAFGFLDYTKMNLRNLSGNLGITHYLLVCAQKQA